MKNVAKIIFDLIENEIVSVYGYNCFLSRKYLIRDRIADLAPGAPWDGTTGFISFDVPGRDRMKIKTRRFLTRKLDLNNGFLNDKSIGIIADNINSELFGVAGIDIKLVSGRDITRHYELETGGSSCMTGENYVYTLLYEENPDRFQLLVMFYQNDSSRAIISKLDNGRFYMDRVYSTCNFLSNRMRDYAIKKGWAYRKTDKAEDLSVCNISPNEIVVSNLSYKDVNIPFMDTMKRGCLCGQGLTISLNHCFDVELGGTDGYFTGGTQCYACGERVPEPEDDGCWAFENPYCINCFSELFIYCEDCGEAIYRDDSRYILDRDVYVCENCAYNNAVCCEDCGEYSQDNYVVVGGEYGGGYVCLNCIDSSNYGRCADCGNYFYSEDLICGEDGEYYCEYCEPEDETEDEARSDNRKAKDCPGQLKISWNG